MGPQLHQRRVCERSIHRTQTIMLLHKEHRPSGLFRYATMAERGKAGAMLIGARVTGAASPGFDVQTGKSGARSGFPYRSRLRACEYF